MRGGAVIKGALRHDVAPVPQYVVDRRCGEQMPDVTILPDGLSLTARTE